ncbi:hypothetical protein C4D60_Mb04t03250 [Musa balbisiana]|uniref:Uncharacterized protein n=1 Tax=Musa balbisiana TaxID=52838 RepID=A0A4S8K9E3_MUSBA|nr:hypothetical protein C4D60_Mb04t03250 [Musa balbisiana]
MEASGKEGGGRERETARDFWKASREAIIPITSTDIDGIKNVVAASAGTESSEDGEATEDYVDAWDAAFVQVDQIVLFLSVSRSSRVIKYCNKLVAASFSSGEWDVSATDEDHHFWDAAAFLVDQMIKQQDQAHNFQVAAPLTYATASSLVRMLVHVTEYETSLQTAEA